MLALSSLLHFSFVKYLPPLAGRAGGGTFSGVYKNRFFVYSVRMYYKEPEQYRVIMLNDDYTFPEFMVAILGDVFDMWLEDAKRLTLEIQEKGEGTAGTYTWDIAMTKAREVRQIAEEHGFPLRCIVVNEYGHVG